jgi:acetyl-CoA carboxylase biotin carboxyl carrier protein
MDLRKLKTLIDLVAESGISELEVTEGESKVKIVKGAPAGQNQMVMMQAPYATTAPVAASAVAHAAADPVPAAAAEPAPAARAERVGEGRGPARGDGH